MAGSVRVINQSFQLQAEIEDYESLVLVRRWHKPGEFEFKINANKENISSLVKGNILFLDTRYDTGCIIRQIQKEIGKDGKKSELITVKGQTLAGLTTQRIIIPPAGNDYLSYSDLETETIMKMIIQKCFTNPVDWNRAIEWMDTATDQSRGAVLDYRGRYKYASKDLETLSLLSDLGWRFDLNFTSLKAVFDVYVGLDRTYDNGVNSPAVFSPDFENIYTQMYIDSDYNLANLAVVGGQGEGSARTIVTVGTDTGADRFEIFIDARDASTTDELTARGTEKLLETPGLFTLEGTINPNGNLIYRTDYDLGDLVTIQNKNWNLTMDARIIEVQESYQSSGFELDITFGSNIPTLSQMVNRQIMNKGGDSAFI